MLGDGSQGNPYQIANFTDLEQLNVKLSQQYKYWVLTADIDASPTSAPGYNNGLGWLPVGTDSVPFMSNIDGQGHSITGLYINRPSIDFVGLIGYARGNDTVIQNINFVDCNVTGKSYVGTLAGSYFPWNKYHNVSVISVYTYNCNVYGVNQVGNIIGRLNPYLGTSTLSNLEPRGSVNGTGNNIGGIVGQSQHDGRTNGSNLVVDGNHLTINVSNTSDYVGGLFGELQTSYLDKCHVTNLTISGARDFVGGFVGFLCRDHTITNCYCADVNISARNYVGGLFGTTNPWMRSIEISKCFTTGVIQCSGNRVGGFCGEVLQAGTTTITNCFSHVNVSTSGSIVAGFVAYAQACVTNKCYSKGSVSGTTSGGFVAQDGGYNSSSTGCYWDKETSGQNSSVFGTGKTTAQMKTQNTFTDWDFSTVWRIGTFYDGYPYVVGAPLILPVVVDDSVLANFQFGCGL